MAKKQCDPHELIGQVVMPKDGAGKPGIVFSVTSETSLAYVELSDGTHAEYSVGQLITLASRTMIMQRLMGNWSLSPDDFRDALKTCRLIQQKRFAEALETAIQNSVTKTICTVACHQWLEAKNGNGKRKGLSK